MEDLEALRDAIAPYLPEARSYATACFEGKRWDGKTLLIILDTALTSTGFSYFSFVEPRVRRFERELLDSLTLSSSRNLFLQRSWYCVSDRCAQIMLSAINSFSSNDEQSERERLIEWARNADPFRRDDPFSKTKGLGVFSIQYLRGQLGLDVPIPDRSVRKFLSAYYKNELKTPSEVMNAIDEVSFALDITRLELVWAIWIHFDSAGRGKLTAL
ncbi:hypothetical protein PQ610_04085 [Tardisphaera miroshnichenkoae]